MADACFLVCLFSPHTSYITEPGGRVNVFLDPHCHFQIILLLSFPKSLEL